MYLNVVFRPYGCVKFVQVIFLAAKIKLFSPWKWIESCFWTRLILLDEAINAFMCFFILWAVRVLWKQLFTIIRGITFWFVIDSFWEPLILHFFFDLITISKRIKIYHLHHCNLISHYISQSKAIEDGIFVILSSVHM